MILHWQHIGTVPEGGYILPFGLGILTDNTEKQRANATADQVERFARAVQYAVDEGELRWWTTGSRTADVHSDGYRTVLGNLIALGNLILKKTGETAVEFLYDGTLGEWINPTWQFGRQYLTPFGPAVSWFFRATGIPERRTLSHENTGTTALIHDDQPRASWEAYDDEECEFPWHRINSDTSAYEIGAGGRTASIGGLVRTGGNLVTATFTRPHKFSVGDIVALHPGEANFPETDPEDAGSYYTVASIIGDPGTSVAITFASTGSNVASTAKQKLSANTDVHVKRIGRNAAAVALGGSDKLQLYPDTVQSAAGIRIKSGGAYEGPVWIISGNENVGDQVLIGIDASAGTVVATLPAVTGKIGRWIDVLLVAQSGEFEGQITDGVDTFHLYDTGDAVRLYATALGWRSLSYTNGAEIIPD